MEGQGRSRKVMVGLFSKLDWQIRWEKLWVGWVVVACRIIVSAPVPVPFLWTLDLGLGFGTWIWDWTWAWQENCSPSYNLDTPMDIPIPEKTQIVSSLILVYFLSQLSPDLSRTPACRAPDPGRETRSCRQPSRAPRSWSLTGPRTV